MPAEAAQQFSLKLMDATQFLVIAITSYLSEDQGSEIPSELHGS